MVKRKRKKSHAPALYPRKRRKGKRTETYISSHTRRVDKKDLWGRFSHSKYVKVKGYWRKK